MAIPVNNATILRSLVQKLDGGEFSVNQNLTVFERVIHWIVNLCSPGAQANNDTRLNDPEAVAADVENFARQIMAAEIDQNDNLLNPIQFQIGERCFEISQRGAKLYCKNLSNKNFTSQMGDLTIQKLKNAFFDEHRSRYCTNDTGGETLALVPLTGIDTSEKNFAGMEINAAQLQQIAESGGNLRGVKLEKNSNLKDMDHETILNANIDKTMAQAMINAGADQASVIAAYTNSEVMNGNFSIDITELGIDAQAAYEMVTQQLVQQSYLSAVQFI